LPHRAADDGKPEKRFTFSTAFIGASGISETGVTVSDLSEAEIEGRSDRTGATCYPAN
jgi:DeoR/GlpR family transcriptional regulator of sugar metabolism